MGMDSKTWLYWPKKNFEKLFNPLQKSIYASSIKISEWKQVIGIPEKQKIIILENENSGLQEKVAILEKENQKLKELTQDKDYLLQVPTSPKWNFLPAQVLRSNGTDFLINKGKENQLKEGMIVIRGNKDLNTAILIGKIIQVNPISSLVSLPSSTNKEIAVELIEGGEGFVKGKINGEIELFNVLQEVEIKQNELVVTSGKEEKYPKGLVIGRVKNIIKEESEVYQKAIIEPIRKYSELENIFVVLVSDFKR